MKENKRVGLTQKGNKKALLLTYLVVLTASQEEKLSCEPLLSDIERIAKKLEIDWAIELSANVEYNTLAVSRVYETEIGECEFRNIENATHNFLDAIDRLELKKQAPEPECPSHENAGENVGPALISAVLAFDEECIKYSVGVEVGPFFKEYCCIPREIMQEMCKLYLKAHEQD